MAAKLSAEEFAERTRAANRRRSARQRDKQVQAGKVATSIWLTTSAKDGLIKIAADRGLTISAAASEIIEAATK